MKIKEALVRARALEIMKGGMPKSFEYATALLNKKLLKKTRGGYRLTDKAKKMVRVIMTGGVFDILHPGHLYMLEKCKKMGDLLVVIVAHDKTVKKRKKKKPIHSHFWRARMVGALKPVDVVLIGDPHDRLRVIRKVEPSLVVFGYDQEPFETGCKWIQVKEKLNESKFKTSKIRELDSVNRE
ncbi:MAG: adenylyltransferase/cytidyltransferase family protein [Candidatus Micrarchaeia archaeon]